MPAWEKIGPRALRRRPTPEWRGRLRRTGGRFINVAHRSRSAAGQMQGIRPFRSSGSDEMAYIVGLTATDGCLFTGRRKINFKSEDRQLVETYLSVLGRTNRVKQEKTRRGGIVFF